jgi:hypothetical protein
MLLLRNYLAFHCTIWDTLVVTADIIWLLRETLDGFRPFGSKHPFECCENVPPRQWRLVHTSQKEVSSIYFRDNKLWKNLVDMPYIVQFLFRALYKSWYLYEIKIIYIYCVDHHAGVCVWVEFQLPVPDLSRGFLKCDFLARNVSVK